MVQYILGWLIGASLAVLYRQARDTQRLGSCEMIIIISGHFYKRARIYDNDDMKMRVYIYLCVYAIVIKTTKQGRRFLNGNHAKHPAAKQALLCIGQSKINRKT